MSLCVADPWMSTRFWQLPLLRNLHSFFLSSRLMNFVRTFLNGHKERTRNHFLEPLYLQLVLVTRCALDYLWFDVSLMPLNSCLGMTCFVCLQQYLNQEVTNKTWA